MAQTLLDAEKKSVATDYIGVRQLRIPRSEMNLSPGPNKAIFRAEIAYKGSIYRIGHFATLEAAAHAYNVEASKLRGVPLNPVVPNHDPEGYVRDQHGNIGIKNADGKSEGKGKGLGKWTAKGKGKVATAGTGKGRPAAQHGGGGGGNARAATSASCKPSKMSAASYHSRRFARSASTLPSTSSATATSATTAADNQIARTIKPRLSARQLADSVDDVDSAEKSLPKPVRTALYAIRKALVHKRHNDAPNTSPYASPTAAARGGAKYQSSILGH